MRPADQLSNSDISVQTSDMRTGERNDYRNPTACGGAPSEVADDLPRLKMTLVSFWSAGCQFEGQQVAFSEAWYYSTLNATGRLFRIRVREELVGVSLLLLCGLRWSREMLETSSWFGFDGRVATAFYADELKSLTLVQPLTTSVALRINGNVRSFLLCRVGISAVNLVPVVFDPLADTTARITSRKLSRIERILAIRPGNVVGLGFPNTKRRKAKETDVASTVQVVNDVQCGAPSCVLAQ